jgi:rSAM/selenodomain-associated transferase 2
MWLFIASIMNSVGAAVAGERITVVIPTLNEADEIADAVTAVRSGAGEVIVVDGGSADDTAAVARAAGARVRLAVGANRATALNTGAALARGDVIYFVHADCRPPPGFANDIRAAMDSGAGAGCFRLQFDSDHWLLRLSGWLTRIDIDLFRFGDQSLFVCRDALRAAGGFDERLTVMEDQEMVRQLRHHVRFVIVRTSVTSSARQYRRRGVYRMQLFVYPLTVALYRLGTPQTILLRIYQRLLPRPAETRRARSSGHPDRPPDRLSRTRRHGVGDRGDATVAR